jgi:hypothetical protein
MKGVKTLVQKAGLPSDIAVAKNIEKVIANPKVEGKKIKATPAAVVPVAPPVEIQKVKRVRKVMMDDEGNILKVERKKRVLSDEQKDVLRERLAKAREVRKANRVSTV